MASSVGAAGLPVWATSERRIRPLAALLKFARRNPLGGIALVIITVLVYASFTNFLRAYQLGQERFNWEVEQSKLIARVRETLAGTNACAPRKSSSVATLTKLLSRASRVFRRCREAWCGH